VFENVGGQTRSWSALSVDQLILGMLREKLKSLSVRDSIALASLASELKAVQAKYDPRETSRNFEIKRVNQSS
jgi:hypothetical protein